MYLSIVQTSDYEVYTHLYMYMQFTDEMYLICCRLWRKTMCCGILEWRTRRGAERAWAIGFFWADEKR